MVKLRSPQISEAAALSDLCLRAKAVWGYDESFMAACEAELTISPSALSQSRSQFQVAEDDSGVMGIARVVIGDSEADLELLYVDPARMRAGAGRALYAWATGRAQSLGAARLNIVADPHAVPFYEHMGAKRIGDYPSGSIPGRMLPLLSMPLNR